MKLTTKFMVASSHDIFGESVVKEASFFSQLTVDKEQLFVFSGQKHFETEMEAIEFINNHPPENTGLSLIIQKVFVWEELNVETVKEVA
tara:strand:- start:796 stop:1062 length:267 start_codon:yes stop_codon:yes gene_type:complete